jgi:hypothetical protein
MLWLFPASHPPDFLLAFSSAAANGIQDMPEFDRQEDEEYYYLSYGWTDFDRHTRSLSFPLSKSTLIEAEKEFGYFPEDLRKHLDDSQERFNVRMIEHLKKYVQEMIQKSKYSAYIRIENATAKSFNLKLSVPPSMQKKVKKEFDKIKGKLAKEQEKYLKRMDGEVEEEKAAFFESHGIRLFDGKIGVDHRVCALNNQERMRSILEIMKDNYPDLSLNQFLGLMLSYIQDLRFYIPPLQERGKVILSFWVPHRVLADNFGDCDSKGVTFASLWINFKKYPILLIIIPNHFFVGLGIPSFSGEGLVINGLRFTLCEVTGPGKMPPGMIGRYSQASMQNGQYQYQMIN